MKQNRKLEEERDKQKKPEMKKGIKEEGVRVTNETEIKNKNLCLSAISFPRPLSSVSSIIALLLCLRFTCFLHIVNAADFT
jgi:hypothetical protein